LNERRRRTNIKTNKINRIIFKSQKGRKTEIKKGRNIYIERERDREREREGFLLLLLLSVRERERDRDRERERESSLSIWLIHWPSE
jgi:hypothetical protein